MVERGKIVSSSSYSSSMGNPLSKKKKKTESLMTQSKAVVGDESPPSSPRNLSATLSSGLLTQEFRTFLTKLDKAEGEDEECSRVTSLQFVLDIRELKDMTAEDKQEELQRIGEIYFKVPGEGLTLDNNQLWVRCADVCRAGATGYDQLRWLYRARDAVLREIDELHVVFLEQRAPAARLSQQIANCIL